jgi:hypothetical protein
MISVRRDDVVLRFERREGAHANGLLANVQMKKAADFSFGVGSRALFFDATDEKHLPVQVREVLKLAAWPRRRWGSGLRIGGRVCWLGHDGDRHAEIGYYTAAPCPRGAHAVRERTPTDA